MNRKDEELKKMTDRELADEIAKFNDDQMIRIKKSSITNGIFSLMSIIDKINNMDADNCRWEDELKEFKDLAEELVDLYKNIDEDSKERALEIRENLYRKKTILDGYLTEFSYLGEIIDEKGMETIAKESITPNRSVEGLLTSIEKKLNESVDSYSEYIRVISDIIRVLPMCIVRDNYYDILRETFRRNFKNLEKSEIELQSENYKRQFDSRIRQGYGMEFDYYFMEIGKMGEIDLSDKEIDEFEEMIDDIQIKTSELIELKEIALILGIVSNMLIIANLTRDVDVDMEELLAEWKEVVDADEETQEKFAKKLYDTIYSVERNIQENLIKYEALTIEASSRKDFDYDLIEEKLKDTAEVLSFFNDMSLAPIEYIEAHEIELGDESYIDKHIEGIIQYMDRAMKGIGNFERKIRMRRILSTVPLPFMNVEEFKNYVRYSLDERLIDREIVNFKIQQIEWILEDKGEK